MAADDPSPGARFPGATTGMTAVGASEGWTFSVGGSSAPVEAAVFSVRASAGACGAAMTSVFGSQTCVSAGPLASGVSAAAGCGASACASVTPLAFGSVTPLAFGSVTLLAFASATSR